MKNIVCWLWCFRYQATLPAALVGLSTFLVSSPVLRITVVYGVAAVLALAGLWSDKSLAPALSSWYVPSLSEFDLSSGSSLSEESAEERLGDPNDTTHLEVS